jgi:hypothetical protein
MNRSMSRAQFPRRDGETDADYIERLLDELDKLLKLEWLIRRDMANVGEIARYAGLRTRDEWAP